MAGTRPARAFMLKTQISTGQKSPNRTKIPMRGIKRLRSNRSALNVSSTSSSSKSDRCVTLRKRKKVKQQIPDFEAVDIKWSYNNPVATVDDFHIDIYTRWRAAEKNFGVIEPDFILPQRLGVDETGRRDVVLDVLYWRKNFDIKHETLHLAFYLFDKCLDSFHMRPALLKDICAVTLVLASKCEEYHPLKFSNVISLGLTTTRDAGYLGELELKILHEVNYKLTYPTPFMFMNYFHSIIRSPLHVIYMANYLLELALLSTKYRKFGGAFTAHAAVCVACGIVSAQPFSMAALKEAEEDLAHFSGIQSGTTRKIMRELIGEFKMAAEEEHTIWSEYAAIECCEVSVFKIPEEIIVALFPS